MKNGMGKRLIAALAAAVLMMTMGLAGALAEGEDAAVVADLTTEPVLLASVNGTEIWSNNKSMQDLMNSYISYYSSMGYDTSDEGFLTYLNAIGLRWAVDGALYEQKATELGVEPLTEEQRTELETAAKAEWEEAVSYYAQSQGNLTEESTEEEKLAARVDAIAYIESNYHFTEDSYVHDYVEGNREIKLRENVQKAVLGDVQVTDDEVTSYFNDLVEEDKKTYEGNVPMYEYYTKYMGSNSYYVPEGYRGITHILLEVDKELMDNYSSLVARMEEQQEEETADEQPAENAEAAATETETAEQPAESAEAAAAEQPAETAEAPAAETEAAPAADTAEQPVESAEPAATEEPKEPVTQEMIDAAKQAILDSVQAQVDEIMAKYQAGTPFADLIAEYGTDPGMTQEPNKTNGYAVHKDSILWDPAFTEGAMGLKNIGDVSEPVLGSRGIHLLHYTRDIPAGAVELTEEIRAQLKEELMSEKENTAVSAMVEEWKGQAEIVYTDEGQAMLDAAEEQEKATVDTTEATEEVLSEEK